MAPFAYLDTSSNMWQFCKGVTVTPDLEGVLALMNSGIEQPEEIEVVKFKNTVYAYYVPNERLERRFLQLMGDLGARRDLDWWQVP